jgi:hypothetical protein
MRSIFGRKALRTLARLALAGFVFAQSTLALAACRLPEPSAAQALIQAGAAAGEPCHEQNEDSAVLCVAHCITTAQGLEKPFWKPPLPATPAVAVFLVAPPFVAPPLPALDAPPPHAGPPPRILYRTLLI